MDTTVTSTDRVVQKKIELGGGPKSSGPNDGRSRGNGNGDRGDGKPARFSPAKYRIGMWVALAGVAMLFTSLTSAYIVRANLANDWHVIAMPRVLWLSTALIVLSSVTLEIARRGLKKGRSIAYQRWLLATVILGLAFLASQILAWRQLVTQGIYVSSNPHSSFFYVLTGAHGLHLLGGILGLDFLLLRSWRRREQESEKRQAITGAIALYWHFMDGLWIYLFLLLFLWR